MQANDALELLGPEPIIAEKWISVLCGSLCSGARSPRGEIAVYPMMTNSHSHHILDVYHLPTLRRIGRDATSGSGDCQGGR